MINDETAKKENGVTDGVENTEQHVEDAFQDVAEDNVASLHLNPENIELLKAQTRIAELETQVADFKDRALRALAETENVRRRAEKDKVDASKFGVSNFARSILPVTDNLRRALDAMPQELSQTNEIVRNLMIGIEATEKELLRALESAGVQRINPMGEQFNPNFHEVMFEMDAAGQPAGTVMQVIEVGYMIHDRLLRPARVGVVRGTPDNHSFDTVA